MRSEGSGCWNLPLSDISMIGSRRGEETLVLVAGRRK